MQSVPKQVTIIRSELQREVSVKGVKDAMKNCLVKSFGILFIIFLEKAEFSNLNKSS